MCLTQQGTQITIPLQKAEMNKKRNDTLKKLWLPLQASKYCKCDFIYTMNAVHYIAKDFTSNLSAICAFLLFCTYFCSLYIICYFLLLSYLNF